MNSMIKFNGNRNSLIFPELPSLFDDFITRDFFNFPLQRNTNAYTLPAVNINETDSAFELSMAVPGMDKNDFSIRLENNRLCISAQHENSSEAPEQQGRFTRREFSYRSFSREFNLPENQVNEDNITASYKDGILQVSVPKKEPVERSALKQIAVN